MNYSFMYSLKEYHYGFIFHKKISSLCVQFDSHKINKGCHHLLKSTMNDSANRCDGYL